MYGECSFFAGRNGADDAREQPFTSLYTIHSFYPTEKTDIKLRLQTCWTRTL